MIKVQIKKLDPGVEIPEYKTSGSSGVDLKAFIKNKVIIKPFKSIIIPTGLSIAVPENCEIQIRPRSGLAANSNIGILNTPGTIDSDYRGEIKVIMYNHSNKEFSVNNGDRIAQMILMPVFKFKFEEVDILSKTVRGTGGFGSTGK